MELRNFVRGVLTSVCAVGLIQAIPAGAVTGKAAVIQAAVPAKPATVKVIAQPKVDTATSTAAPVEMSKAAWGAPHVEYYGLPTSDAQRKFK